MLRGLDLRVIHGLAGAPHVIAKTWHVIAKTWRGNGLTIGCAPILIDAMARTARAVFRVFGFGPTDLTGLSRGRVGAQDMSVRARGPGRKWNRVCGRHRSCSGGVWAVDGDGVAGAARPRNPYGPPLDRQSAPCGDGVFGPAERPPGRARQGPFAACRPTQPCAAPRRPAAILARPPLCPPSHSVMPPRTIQRFS